jgi:hypothetical protein
VPEQPIPRHLRSMLAISRAAASGRGDMPVLEALAETIRRELSFHVVTVNMLEETGDTLRVVLVFGDELGLPANRIPLEARILAVVDAFLSALRRRGEPGLEHMRAPHTNAA